MNFFIATSTMIVLTICLNSSWSLRESVRQIGSGNVTQKNNRCSRRLDKFTYEVALDGVLSCILDLVRAWNWAEVGVLTSTDEQELMVGNKNVSNEIKELICRCNSMLVFGSNVAVAKIIKLFQLDGLMTSTQVWIIGLSEPLVSSKLIPAGANTIGISASAAPQYVVVSSIRDHDMENKMVSGGVVRGDSGVGCCAASTQLFDLFHASGSEIKTVQFGDWRRGRGLNLWDKLEQDRLPDAWRLQQRLVRGITFHQPPFASVRNASGKMQFSGYIWEIVNIMSQQLNFKFQVQVNQVAELGSKMNNTYTGLVGALHRREADIALTIFAITRSRQDGMSFLFTVNNGLMGLAFRAPGKYVSPVAHVLAFSPNVWMLITVSTITLMTFLVASNIVDRVSNTKDTTIKIKTGSKLIKSILSGDLFETDTVGISSKVFLGTYLLLFLIVTACYNSVFMAFFTYSKSPITFTNVEELLATNSFKVTLIKQTGFHDTFSNAEAGLYKDLWQRIVRDKQPLASTTLEGVQALCSNPNLVLLCDVNTPIVYGKLVSCSVSSIRTNHMKDFGHIGVRTDFPYNAVFLRLTLKLKESGILQRLKQNHFGVGTPQTNADEKSDQISLSLNHFSIPFYVLIGGLICSPVALVVEMFLERIKRNSQKNI